MDSYPNLGVKEAKTPISVQSGQGAASNPWGNVGSPRTKGIELTVNTTNITRRHFQWTSSEFSLNRNKVLELDNGQFFHLKRVINQFRKLHRNKTTVHGQIWGYKVIWDVSMNRRNLTTKMPMAIGSTKYRGFCSPAFDFGIFSQMFGSMIKTGIQYTTVERNELLSHFAVHCSPIWYLMLPFYFIFPTPKNLVGLSGCTCRRCLPFVYLL